MSLQQLQQRRNACPGTFPKSMPADGQALIELLDLWVAQGWLRALDRALADFVLKQDAQTQPQALLAVALASYMLGRGHACVDLQMALAEPNRILQIEEADNTEKALPPSPAELLRNTSLEDWRQSLANCTLVDAESSASSMRPLVLAGDRLYLRRYWNHERNIAQKLAKRAATTLPDDPTLPGLLDQLFPTPTDSQTDWQKVACAIAARGNFSVITGGPGTGKTHTVVRLLALLQTLALEKGQPLVIRLAAPTGKAAARMSESINQQLGSQQLGELELSDNLKKALVSAASASTVHRLLGTRPGTNHYTHNASNPLALDVLVVDEASMVGLEMMSCLLDALPEQARLILLGDKDQLASVEAGAVLGELCADAEKAAYNIETRQWLQRQCGVPLAAPDTTSSNPLAQQIVMLRHSRRFEDHPQIGKLATAVNDRDKIAARQALAESNGDTFCIQVSDSKKKPLTDLLINGRDDVALGYSHYLQVLQANRPEADTPADSDKWNTWAKGVLDAFDKFRLLCALRAGPWGVEGINERVLADLEPAKLITSNKQEWFEGRPVMVSRNDYTLDLRNGDIGIALNQPKPDSNGETLLRVAFPRTDGKEGVRFIMPNRLTDVETVFAMTVHKSQGSEFEHTALLIPDHANEVLTKELIYTAITRSKQYFTLIESGEPSVFDEAVGKHMKRLSGLQQHLQVAGD